MIPFDRHPRPSFLKVSPLLHQVQADHLAPARTRMELAEKWWARHAGRVELAVDMFDRLAFVDARTRKPVQHPIGIFPELLHLVVAHRHRENTWERTAAPSAGGGPGDVGGRTA